MSFIYFEEWFVQIYAWLSRSMSWWEDVLHVEKRPLALCRPCWALFCGWQERCGGKDWFGWGLLGGSLSHWYSSLRAVHAYTLGSRDSCGVAQNIKPLKIFFRHRQVVPEPRDRSVSAEPCDRFFSDSPSCGSIVQRAARPVISVLIVSPAVRSLWL